MNEGIEPNYDMELFSNRRKPDDQQNEIRWEVIEQQCFYLHMRTHLDKMFTI